MSRIDDLQTAILRHMTPPIRRKVVPHHLAGILPAGTTMQDLVAEFVRNADDNNGLQQLCDDLRNDNPSAEFHSLLDQCLGVDNPFNTGRPRWYDSRLPLAKPLIARDALRAGLFEMLEADPGNPRVMIVRGDAPGKSYCRCLVQHVARELGFPPPILVNLFDVESVNRLAEQLVDKLGLSHTGLRARFSTEVREGKDFNNWLIGQIGHVSPGRRLVFVFDHLSKPGIPQDVANTVLDFAQRAMRRELENVWIILLDCPLPEALLEEDVPFEEVVQPIPKESVTDFLDWLRLALKKPGQAPPTLSQVITNLLNEPFPLTKRQFKELTTSIITWTRGHK